MRTAQPWRPWPSLAGLPRNARGAIITEPLWAVFGMVVLYYAPLYMREVGLSSTEIGWIGSITLAASFVFQTVAAAITNRLGRRRTTLLVDLVSWTVPMFVWASARSFEAFVVAGVLNAAVRIAMVSWSLLVVEDVAQSQRARVLGILNTIAALCGALAPLVGLFMSRYGAVPTLRVFYALGGVGMTTMFLWRNAITQETGVGREAMREHGELHPWQSLLHTLREVLGLRRHPGLGAIIAFYVLSVFIEQMGLFSVLFYGEVLGFGVWALSWVPVATAAVTVLMYGGVLRRLSGVSPERTLVYTRVLGLVGAVLVLLIPAGNLAALLLVVCLLSAATFLTQTYRDVVLFARLPGGGGADLYSGAQLLSLLVSTPAAGLAGLLYHGQPRTLFVLIAALNVGLLLLALGLGRFHRAGA